MKLPKYKIERAGTQEEGRYIPDGVYLDVERGLLVATDGHILAVVPAETEKHDTSGMLSRRTFQMARDAERRVPKTARQANPVRIGANGRAVVRSPYRGEAFVAKRDTGQFPNWRAVVKGKFESAPDIVFDVELLRRAVEAIADPGDPQRNAVAIWIDRSAQPATGAMLLAPASSVQPDRLAILMPMRSGAHLRAQAVLRVADGKQAETQPEVKPEEQPVTA